MPLRRHRPSPYGDVAPLRQASHYEIADPDAGFSAEKCSADVQPDVRAVSGPPLSPASAAPRTRRTARGAADSTRPATGAHAVADSTRPATGAHAVAGSRRAARAHAPAGPRLRRRPRPTLAQKTLGVALAAGLTSTAAVVLASSSRAETPMTRLTYAPVGAWAWYNDRPLGKTDSLDQYAQAEVSGLTDAEHNAGFLLRYANRHDRVLVAVSGTGWRIEPTGGNVITGTFRHAASGLFRAEVKGGSVRILWNGHAVATRTLPRDHTGHAVVATVWQSEPGVTMTHLEASSLGAPVPAPPLATPTTTAPRTSASTPAPTTPTPSPSASASPSGSPSSSPATKAERPAVGPRGWLSGASGDNLADGGFDHWRGTPAGIAGSWDDANPSVQQELYSICGGQYSEGKWNRPLDLAVGGIFLGQGDSWSAAAGGAYNDRWRRMLTTAKRCWGNRDAGDLYLRFAHEMNLSTSDWRVEAGQEADFRKAFAQLSNVRYEVFPGVMLVLSVNDGSSGGMADVRKLVPGPDSQGRPTVNVYGADSYNSWPHCTSRASCEEKFNATTDNGSPLGIEKHREFAESMGLPFSVNEYSNNGDPGDSDGGGESPAFIQAFYSWAKAHAGDVNHPKPGQFLYDCLFNLWKQYELQPTTLQPDTAATYRSLRWGRA
jgi:hypothetical protein